jgi:hypothetical protein
VFDLLVDIYRRTETTVNAEPQSTFAPATVGVPAQFLSLSGRERLLAAGAGVPLAAKLAAALPLEVAEGDEVRNVRMREGEALVEGPPAWRVLFVASGRRRRHLELDLEGLR